MPDSQKKKKKIEKRIKLTLSVVISKFEECCRSPPAVDRLVSTGGPFPQMLKVFIM